MECYFGSHKLPENNGLDKSTLVSFHIPEVGIRFKAPFAAINADHGDLAALLALLEFIDTNQKQLPNKAYEIYGNNLKVINGVNHRDELPESFAHLLEKAEKYRKKYRFSLDWQSRRDNPELDSLFD